MSGLVLGKFGQRTKEKRFKKKKFSREEVLDLMTNIERFPEYCEKIGRIIPVEAGPAIPFILNPIQLWIHRRYVVPAYLAGHPIRLNILKMRQSGISTWAEEFNYWCAQGHENWNALVVASDEDQAGLVFEMMHTFHESFPEGQHGFPRIFIKNKTAELFWFKKPDPRFKGFTEKELKLWWLDLNSRIRIRSAEQRKRLGRAGTWQSVHASEVAYWPELRKAMTALMACCHERPETSVILETTANGMNEYYDFWENRSVGSREIPFDWQNIFIPWYWDPKYEIKTLVSGGVSLEPRHYISEDEEDLFERILADEILWSEIDPGLTEERIWNKLFWRRFAIAHKCQGDLEEFNQEWPSTPTEAFKFSGQNVFKASALARIEKDIREPVWKGNIAVEPVNKAISRYTRKGVELEVEMHAFEYGRLSVYEEPKENEVYGVFADVAEGKGIEGGVEAKSKWDFSVANIIKVSSYPPLEQVAIWHGQIDVSRLGYLLVALAKWYNHALLAWESNSVGAALKGPIVEHCRYRNYFMRKDWDMNRTKKKTPGFYTSPKNKMHMVVTGQAFVHNGEIVIRDRALLTEMKSYSVLRENRWGALRGHDDRVMTLLMGCLILEPRISKLKRQSELLKEAAEEKTVERGGHRIDMGMITGEGESMNPYFGNDF